MKKQKIYEVTTIEQGGAEIVVAGTPRTTFQTAGTRLKIEDRRARAEALDMIGEPVQRKQRHGGSVSRPKDVTLHYVGQHRM